ncbi:hypothetical protein DERF_012136 [Dermatophagoides farinae]|uniref:Uncharacterized protein n=1 Tax=Dermatophagoides farinae TaxID=6954 RepID=A0A922HRC8_DERFA|nr:hypothetical protein HUG17_8928 [Dermatophagoides farinae]KAH9501278.1 hypothetical protein DERF_012136 [Dermatophagoides farinae]
MRTETLFRRMVITSDSQLSIQYCSVEGILKSIINQHHSLIDSIEKEKSLNFIPEQNRNCMIIRNELDTTDESMFQRLKGKL